MRSRTAQHGKAGTRRRSLWRSLWALVLLLHAPATIKVFATAFAADTEASTWSSLLLLAVTNLFFIAEIIFAWSFHLLNDRRRVTAFLLVIALLHVGVIDRVVPDLVLRDDLQLVLVLAFGAAATRRWLRPGLVTWWRGLTHLLAEHLRQLARRSFGDPGLAMAGPCSPQVLSRTLPDRAPPRRF